MNVIIKVLPTVFLVALSQILIKWRSEYLVQSSAGLDSSFQKYFLYFTDPYVISAYVCGLVGSFAWLFTVSRLPLGQAFPIYQGLTFVLVLIASGYLLGEPITVYKIIGAVLIIAGIAIGSQQ